MGVWRSLRLRLGWAKAKVCVLVLGLPHAGKSSCVRHFTTSVATTDRLTGHGTHVQPHCVAHKLRVPLRNGTVRKLVALDFGHGAASEVKAQTQWQLYFPVAQAILWVLDASQYTRLQHVQDALDRACANPDLKDVPLCVVVNRADKDDSATVDQVMDALNLAHLSGGPRPWRVVEANAVTGVGLTGVFEWLLQNAIRRFAGIEVEVQTAVAISTEAAAQTES